MFSFFNWNKSKIKVKILSKSEKILEEMVTSLSSTNELGDFDILPYHANFVANIREKIILRFDKNNQKSLNITSGIIRVKDNDIEIYLDI